VNEDRKENENRKSNSKLSMSNKDKSKKLPMGSMGTGK